jgi:hypothetical protein
MCCWKQAVRYVLLTLSLSLALGTDLLSADSQSPSQFAGEAVRQALAEGGDLPQLSSVLRTDTDLRDIVSHRLKPTLLVQVESVTGRDFHYTFRNSATSVQVGVIVLRYPSATVSKRMEERLRPLDHYFQNSKVLIRFSAAQLGTLLVIAYSENSGDDRIVKAIDRLPTDFQKASQNRASYWSESGTGDAPH